MSYADSQTREIQRAADRAEDRSFDEIISAVDDANASGETITSLCAVLRFAFMHLPKSKQESMREQLLDLGL